MDKHDTYDDYRFDGSCPTCGQEFLQERLKQIDINFKFVFSAIEKIHDNICSGQNGTWQDRTRQTVLAAITLKQDMEILDSALHPQPLPCGHPGQYAFTADGGKHVVCLVCVKEKKEQMQKGLEDIIRHQEIVAGTTAARSTVVAIARKALGE